MREFVLPSLGADMDDATLVQWYIAPGQPVRRGELICVVETQKGAIDVEVWSDGVLALQVAEPGQQIPVGQTIAVIAEHGEDVAAVQRDYQQKRAGGSPIHSGEPASPVVGPRRPPKPTASRDLERASAAEAAIVSPPGKAVSAGGRLRVSPAARRRAAELGVDLNGVECSSPDGAITLADVERTHAQARAARPAVDRMAAMRAAISAAMARSKREIPHYYVSSEISIEAAARHLEAINLQLPVDRRILPFALQLKAIAMALRVVPQLNGLFVDGQFRPSDAIHIGVVTSLRGGGLVVPAIHAVDTLPLPELMADLRDTLSRARSGKLRASDLADGVVTVSNMGDLGADTVWGVIYPPQVAIIGLGRIRPRPVVRDGTLVVERTVITSVAADHRVSDGLQAARFLQAFADVLAQPQSL